MEKIRTDIVTTAQVENRLYILDNNPHQLIIDEGIDVIFVPQDYINEYKELNPTLSEIIQPYNYGTIQKTKPEFYKKVAVIMTNESNPAAMAFCYANGFASNENYMTMEEAEAVTGEDLGEKCKDNLDLTHFEEFQYFTGVEKLYKYAFWGCDNLEIIACPLSLKELDAQIWGIGATQWNQGHRSKLKHISGLKNVEVVGSNCLQHLTELLTCDFSDKLRENKGNFFIHCPKLEDCGDLSGIRTTTNAILAGTNVSSVYLNVAGKLPSNQNLKTVHIPWEETTQLPFTFLGSDGSTGTIGAAVEEIPNMPNLLSFGVGSKGQSITFQNCFYLRYVGAMPKVEVIPQATFLGCCRLEYLKDLSSVTTLGVQAFDMCFALQEINLPECTTVGNQAFRINTSMTEGDLIVNFGNAYSKMTIASNAFSGRHRNHIKIYCEGVELTNEQYTAVGVTTIS